MRWDAWDDYSTLAPRTSEGDFKRAAGWVSRQRKHREWGFDPSKVRPFSESALKTVSKAEIALRNADLGIEPPKPESPKRVVYPAPPPKAIEERIFGWIKGFVLQVLWMLLMVPLIILFGTDYRHGGIFGIVMAIVFLGGLAVGILIGIPTLVFRFVRAKVVSAKSGKPIRKD